MAVELLLTSAHHNRRSPPAIAFAPKSGDVLVANSSSYVDVLYLAFR